MKIFKDNKLTLEVETLDLGIVSAGCIEKFEFFVKNDTSAELRDLKFALNHEEVKILEAPKDLNAGESKPLIVEWAPSVTLKQGLKACVLIKGDELWR